MTIPLVDLHAQYVPLKEQIFAGFEKVFDTMHLNLGENVQAFEKEFAEFCGVDYGIGVSDGTAALQVVLSALGIGPGDEVITVSHTFIATAEAIVLVGAQPVFVDIQPDTCLMDVTKIEAKITPRTKAVLPVHLYGQMVDMEPLLEIARHHGLKVIEDACQAHGATYKGRRAGSLGDAAAFSFYLSKNLGAYGEGGFITTSDPEIARKARMIRDHGSEHRYSHELVGLNARLDELQAVVLRAKLPHLEEYNRLRREHAWLYSQFLEGTPLKTPVECPGNEHIYHLYAVQTPQRDELQAWLKEKGIGAGIHYPIPVHLQQSMRSIGYKHGDLPFSEMVAEKILSLPMYPEMTKDQIETVSRAVRDFFH